MKIPRFLHALYGSELKLSAFTADALNRIENHIAATRMVFFPEYTDHGINHVELTLQTALDLATKPARDLLTPIDATCLTVAVSLHDLGMHLTKDGFQSLIAKDSPWRGVPFFDKSDWSTLWTTFLSEAARFDGRKLRQLFGENYRPARPIPAKGELWDDFDYLLVGEFLRRHHPRLAHEIALYGLPGKDGAQQPICQSSSEDQRFMADIVGLVARSHGMNLRVCLDYLENKYKNKIDPRRSHPAFLASLLRLADYFQIQAARAPTARTDVESFQSELSESEWTVHQCVRDIHNTGGDPEAIVIIAEPSDVEIFLKLKRWINGLQGELDQCWAILGEVYGLQTHNQLNALGLKIRRVKSNLDDVESFAKTVDYIPERIAFEAANADLLKLLVAPLYGSDPGVGLRELIQNAVDAVRELEESLARRPTQAICSERYQQASDVALRIECDKEENPVEIIITDRGIGMTPEIVRDYFLKAGASFRRSRYWREEYEDGEGHSRVLRTGRFGVGALAGFLLGDEVEITTRHAFAGTSGGIAFSARLDDESISLRRLDCPVGTQIKIRVHDTFKERIKKILPSVRDTAIKFDSKVGHYFLKKPSLQRTFANRPELPVEGWLPLPEDPISADWRSFDNAEFEKVFWSYKGSYPSLACNGIVISPQRERPQLDSQFATPRLSVFDRDGLLPVNLQRNALQTEIPFKPDLLASICEDLATHAILEAPDNVESPWFYDGGYEGFCEPGYHSYWYATRWAQWMLSKRGFILNTERLIGQFRPKLFIGILGGPRNLGALGKALQKLIPPDAVFCNCLPDFFTTDDIRIKGMIRFAADGSLKPSTVHTEQFSLYIPACIIDKINQLRPGKQVKRLLSKLSVESSAAGWRGFPAGALGEGTLLPEVWTLPVDSENPAILFISKVVDTDEAKMAENVVSARWMQLLGSPIVPYSLSERGPLKEAINRALPELLKIREQKKREASKKRKLTDQDPLDQITPNEHSPIR